MSAIVRAMDRGRIFLVGGLSASPFLLFLLSVVASVGLTLLLVHCVTFPLSLSSIQVHRRLLPRVFPRPHGRRLLHPEPAPHILRHLALLAIALLQSRGIIRIASDPGQERRPERDLRLLGRHSLQFRELGVRDGIPPRESG